MVLIQINIVFLSVFLCLYIFETENNVFYVLLINAG